MIEKVKVVLKPEDWNLPVNELEMRCLKNLLLKVDELVDTVNKLETMAKNTNTVLKSLVEENNIHEKQIDELQMKLEPEKCEIPTDKYAEQRKWIGCLVEYGNADDGFRYGILTNIEPRYSAYPFEIDNGREATADCWLPSKTIFYEGK